MGKLIKPKNMNAILSNGVIDYMDEGTLLADITYEDLLIELFA